MNNKPIIIDGVDVAGCPEYRKNTGFCKAAFRPEQEPYCQEFDCYYKQLQRMKEKYKQLTEDLTALQQTYEACEKEYKRVIEENKKLKELLCK